MTTLNITNLPKPISVALEWHLLPGATSERREIDAVAKASGSKIGCIVTDVGSGVTVLGVASERSPGANCGAAWLAKASAGEPLVLVEPIPGGRFWVCAVKAGLPVQNLDVVIDASGLHEKLDEFLRDSPDARICSTAEGLEADYPSVSPQSFAELVSNTKPERLVRISGVSPVAVAGCIVAVLAIGLYVGGDAYLKKLRREAAQAKLTEIAFEQQQRDAEAAQRAAQMRRAAGEEMLRKVVFGQPTVDTAIAAAFRAVEEMPMSTGGWALIGFECNNVTCTVSWERNKNGTVLSFLNAAEKRGWEVSGAEGELAKTTVTLQSAPRQATLESLEERDPFVAALESQLQSAQLAGMGYVLTKAQPLENSMPQPVPQKGEAPPVQTAPLPWHVGTATLKGEQLFSARTVPALLDHPAVSLSYIKADLKTKEWTLEVNYATR